MRRLVALLPLIVMLQACSSKPASSLPSDTMLKPSGGFFRSSSAGFQSGDFANNPDVDRFVDHMVKEYGFERENLHSVLGQAQRLDGVIRLMDRQAPSPSTALPSNIPNGAWLRYRKKFITPDNVQNGVMFWNQYEDALNRAWQIYGVPPEIIVGIIGVETRWGRIMGTTRILDALATLSFAYPRRAAYFKGELEQFLLMAREDGFDPLTLRGSYAGAMGYGQFMPSAFKRYAVDFNGDGIPNLWDPVDAIGSVANYFKAHGWVRNGQVAVSANGQALSLDTGFNTRYSVRTLSAAGLSPLEPLIGNQEVSLLRLDMGNRYQYWYGQPNFYTITRYNHSTHYAMVVWQLGEEVKIARRAQQ